MIESGTTFMHEGQTWEVEKYDRYEDKYFSRNIDSHNTCLRKFTESQVLEGMK